MKKRLICFVFLLIFLSGCDSGPECTEIIKIHNITEKILKSSTYEPWWLVVDEKYDKDNETYIIYYKVKDEETYRKALVDTTSKDENGIYNRIQFEDWDGEKE